MALNPRFAGLRWAADTTSPTPQQPLHTVELFLDYICPFSQKMFSTIHPHVLTHPHARNVQFIFRPQIQPWHPSSTLAHEAAAAVLRIAPARFWAFSARLFAAQRDFFDGPTARETRNQTYTRLAALAGEEGVDAQRVYALLEVGAAEGNAGNAVTDDVKLMVKANRLVGVHVTPTVLFNGVVESSISSSFSKSDWEEWLAKKAV